MKYWFLAAAIAASSAAVTGQPLADPSASTPVAKPTEAEAKAFVYAYAPPHLRRKAELTVLEKSFVPGLRTSPEMAAMLDAFPALGPELTKALAGQIDIYMAEYGERFYPRATAIILESLSKDDVRTLTAFYASALGQKMLELASENVDGTEIIESVVKDEPVDDAATERQTLRTGILAYGKLNEAERATFREVMQTPAGQHLHAAMPKLVALQTELLNAPSPKFDAASEVALEDAFKRVTGLDPAGGEGASQ